MITPGHVYDLRARPLIFYLPAIRFVFVLIGPSHLRHRQLIVQTFLIHQLVVRAGLDDFTVLEKNNTPYVR